MAFKDTETLIYREILWKSKDGKRVIVHGPFPKWFRRTETRPNLKEAIHLRKHPAAEIHDRQGAQSGYAKVWAKNVHEIYPTWGEYSL